MEYALFTWLAIAPLGGLSVAVWLLASRDPYVNGWMRRFDRAFVIAFAGSMLVAFVFAAKLATDHYRRTNHEHRPPIFRDKARIAVDPVVGTLDREVGR